MLLSLATVCLCNPINCVNSELGSFSLDIIGVIEAPKPGREEPIDADGGPDTDPNRDLRLPEYLGSEEQKRRKKKKEKKKKTTTEQ
jgi:hypothetical protein